MIAPSSRVATAFCIALALACCSTLPASAPTASQIESPGEQGYVGDYLFVRLTPGVAGLMGGDEYGGFPYSFRFGRYVPSNALRPGDVIGITIFEVSAVSIFAPPTGGLPPAPSAGSPTAQTPQPRTTTLPALTVEANGTVPIPFVGDVRVAGLSPAAAAKRIEHSLRGQTVNPQVLVSIISNVTDVATVGGEANRPGPAILTLRGERLLDVIGQAGGSKWPASDTDVRLARGRQASTVNLQRVVDDPHENIRIRPNDQVFLIHNPKTFTVLGAAQKVSQYTFDTPDVTLAEAVGRAGGPIDTIGTPAAVYLIREETQSVAQSLIALGEAVLPDGVTVIPANIVPSVPRINVVYRVNMNETEGYVVARNVLVHDRDVILIANAEGAQLLKLLTIARGFSGIASDISGYFNRGVSAGTSTFR